MDRVLLGVGEHPVDLAVGLGDLGLDRPARLGGKGLGGAGGLAHEVVQIGQDKAGHRGTPLNSAEPCHSFLQLRRTWGRPAYR